jgi:hypothetical protein
MPDRSIHLSGGVLVSGSLPRYYEAVRPPAPHRYSPPRSFRCLRFSLARPPQHAVGHIGARGSHVPHRSLTRTRATSMPDTTWPVSRHPPDSFRARSRLRSDVIKDVSTLQRWFADVRLLGSHLTPSRTPFPQRSHLGSFTEAAYGGSRPLPAERSPRAHLHHRCSTATISATFYIATSSHVRGTPISTSFASRRGTETGQTRQPRKKDETQRAHHLDRRSCQPASPQLTAPSMNWRLQAATCRTRPSCRQQADAHGRDGGADPELPGGGGMTGAARA